MKSEFRDDPRYVKWHQEKTTWTGTEVINFNYAGVHKCNLDDFSNFYPPSINDKPRIEELKATEQMYCPDTTDLYGNKMDNALWGTHGESSAYRQILLYLLACVPSQNNDHNIYPGAEWWSMDY